MLQVDKIDASKPVTLTIKQHKKLKVKLHHSRNWYTISGYTLVGDSALATLTDTIALRDITSIKGSVKGNVLRKIGDGILFLGGGFYTAAATSLGLAFMMAGGGLPFFLLSIPSLGVYYVGWILLDTRRFNTVEKWALKISPQTY